MTKKIFFLLFASVVLLGVLSVPSAAQSNNCYGWFIWYFPDPIPRGAVCGPGQGPFSMMCFGQLVTCSPPPKFCSKCATAGTPISLVNGNTFIEQTDLRIPGLSGGLTLVRTWNSIWPPTETGSQVGMFGPNWRSNFEERVFQDSDGFVTYARGDGSFWAFPQGASTVKLAAPANVTATLSQNGTQWTLTFQNGEQRIFNFSNGSLIAIIDRNGNQTQLSYDASNRLVTVTDPASRHLTFTYANSSSGLATGVASDVGLSLSYAYDTQARLSQVTKPDSTTLTFGYDSQSRITSVTDSNGKILESHTYDNNGRGLTSSRALGVEAVTLSYPNP